MITGKTEHIILAILCAFLFLAAVFWVPSLIKDAPTALGTAGTFATAYGVLFAIIELRRAKDASLLARAEAQRAFRAVTSLVTAREIIECQSIIEIATLSLDEGKAISSSTLRQIVKLYSQVFYAEMTNDSSLHRKNRSTIEAYYFNSNSKRIYSIPKHTRQALLSITSQLAELQGSTKNFTEYEK